MHSQLLLVALILVFGCAAFLFGLVYLTCSALQYIGRGIFGVFAPAPRGRPSRARRVAREPLVCPSANCRKVEYRSARFCGRCGTPLIVDITQEARLEARA